MDKVSALVVDDNFYDRSILTSVLHSVNIKNVVHAVNGVDALGQLNSGLRPDYVFLDIQMPIMDGYEVLSELRQMKLDNVFKIFIFSDNYNGREKLPCIEKGGKADLMRRVKRVFREQNCFFGDYA